MSMEIPSITVGEKWWDAEKMENISTWSSEYDLLTALQTCDSSSTYLVEGRIIAALAKRLEEISKMLNLGPLHP